MDVCPKHHRDTGKSEQLCLDCGVGPKGGVKEDVTFQQAPGAQLKEEEEVEAQCAREQPLQKCGGLRLVGKCGPGWLAAGASVGRK